MYNYNIAYMLFSGLERKYGAGLTANYDEQTAGSH